MARNDHQRRRHRQRRRGGIVELKGPRRRCRNLGKAAAFATARGTNLGHSASGRLRGELEDADGRGAGGAGATQPRAASISGFIALSVLVICSSLATPIVTLRRASGMPISCAMKAASWGEPEIVAISFIEQLLRHRRHWRPDQPSWAQSSHAGGRENQAGQSRYGRGRGRRSLPATSTGARRGGYHTDSKSTPTGFRRRAAAVHHQPLEIEALAISFGVLGAIEGERHFVEFEQLGAVALRHGPEPLREDRVGDVLDVPLLFLLKRASSAARNTGIFRDFIPVAEPIHERGARSGHRPRTRSSPRSSTVPDSPVGMPYSSASSSKWRNSARPT
ncbi:unnamed protein product [Acanthosepion pharaonis]|uniref:Uncharacterized protein n=1 Tax=Acanthosepion pharaonis TaxID=158019 RepID=A0A812DL77_ACAPH|nr:unnamed protein product [Sepia pharaonis]